MTGRLRFNVTCWQLSPVQPLPDSGRSRLGKTMGNSSSPRAVTRTRSRLVFTIALTARLDPPTTVLLAQSTTEAGLRVTDSHREGPRSHLGWPLEAGSPGQCGRHLGPLGAWTEPWRRAWTEPWRRACQSAGAPSAARRRRGEGPAAPPGRALSWPDFACRQGVRNAGFGPGSPRRVSRAGD